MGDEVGINVGATVGKADGAVVVGLADGVGVGKVVGLADRAVVVGLADGAAVGTLVGLADGAVVGLSLGGVYMINICKEQV